MDSSIVDPSTLASVTELTTGGRKKSKKGNSNSLNGGINSSFAGYVAEVLKEKSEVKRAYIGFEYECHNGHRFFLNDEMIKTALGHPQFVKVYRYP